MYKFSRPLLLTGTLLSGAALAQNASPRVPAPIPAAPAAATVAPAVPAAAATVSPVTPRGPQTPDAVEKHITGLHRRLGITPAQESLWGNFSSVMRDNARRMYSAYDQRTRAATMTAVDGMRSYADMAKLHAEDLQRLVQPFEALYAAMTPEQRAMADRTFETRAERRREQRS